MTALVLGGGGFLGSRLIALATAEPARLISVDGRPATSDGDVEHITARLSDLDLAEVIDSFQATTVFHLANTSFVPPSFDDPLGDLVTNAGSTLRVLEAIRHSRARPRLVYASSAVVYGDAQEVPMKEDHVLRPTSPYGVGKLAAEHYIRVYAANHGVRALSVRLFSLYGPGQRKQVVYDLMRRALDGQTPLRVIGVPDVERDLVFVDDAARACWQLSMTAAARGEAYNVCTGRPTSLALLAQTILEVVGLEVPVQFTGELRPGDVRQWWGDPSRARRLGVECATALRAGLSATHGWLLADDSGSGQAASQREVRS